MFCFFPVWFGTRNLPESSQPKPLPYIILPVHQLLVLRVVGVAESYLVQSRQIVLDQHRRLRNPYMRWPDRNCSVEAINTSARWYSK
ncbi:hypothetical protein Pcinc_037724 [Petrolisthes cinctipes]|uniref:Uncharacterized protein n=1 Tax=Petrolisthes cinctipes TaxID=88211 RepID=A0AAE1ENP2_PETCI|nr:hypothetical protein Pcinc_037724 [Petrolisthes cinctipes]